jgi:hypothetical protein
MHPPLLKMRGIKVVVVVMIRMGRKENITAPYARTMDTISRVARREAKRT